MDTSEELREALLNLEDAREREKQHREMAEALLAGLRVLVFTEDPQDLFHHLFDVFGEALDFQAAFVLTMNDQGILIPESTSDERFARTVWRPQSMFQRVLNGESVAVFDVSHVDEWRSQPKDVRDAVRSALHFSIGTPKQEAMFIFTHSDRGHFSRNHLTLARRFSMLASQALQKLDTEKRFSDLKERLKAEAKLAELNKKLMESEKKLARAKKMEALGLLAGGVAHDLNNILSGIVSYPELLLMDLPQDSPLRKPMQTIQESGMRAAEVVADLLTMTRGVASEKRALNLNTMVNEYLESPDHENVKKRHPFVQFKSGLDPGLLNINGSSTHIKKSLMNLAINASEAMVDGGVVVISTLNRYLDQVLRGYEDVRTGEYVVLRVSDEGCGMSAEDIERIFEPFYSKKVLGRSGTGLGLAVVWNTVQDHNGYINVKSGEKGTTFDLYFPVSREEITEKTKPVGLEEYMGHGESILVVDDEESQRDIALGILSRLGYHTEAVGSGEEAIDYLREQPMDLLVLDMVMPKGINGRDTYEKIIKIRPGQKAIIASGYAKNKEVVAAQELGAGEYIKKPYTLEKIGVAVKKELEK